MILFHTINEGEFKSAEIRKTISRHFVQQIRQVPDQMTRLRPLTVMLPNLQNSY